MAKIAFLKALDEKPEFTSVTPGYLISVCYSFAKTFESEDMYTSILNEKVSIFINNELIKVEDWHTTEVKDSDIIVVSSNLEGDNAGILMVGLGAILMVVAPYIGGPLIQQGIFMAGVSMAMGGISNLLFQPDMPSMPSISSSKQTQTYNWNGIKTIAQVDTPIPVVYGMHPVGGNIISLFTENDGTNSYLNMLLGLCEGEIEGIVQDKDHTSICSTSDKNDASYEDPAIEINDQPLSFYDDVEWYYRKGVNTSDVSKSKYNPDYQNIIPNFDGARVQYDDGREVTANPNYIEYITTKDVDQVYLNFLIPQLYNGEGTGLKEETVKFKVQYSTNGVDFYNYTGAGTYKYEPSVSGSRSQYCTCTQYKTGNYKYTYKEPTYTIKVTSTNFTKVYNQFKKYGGTYQYTINIDILDANSNLVGSQSIAQSMAADPNPIEEGGASWIVGTVTYNNTTFYVGEYVVSLDHNVLSGDEFTLTSTKITGASSPIISVTGKTKTGLYTTIRVDFNTMDGMPGKDVYYLRTTRVDGGKSDSLKIANNLLLQSVIEIVNGQFIYPNTALLGLRIKATGQLSGSPPNIKTLIKGKKIEVPDLSGSENFQDCFWDDTDTRWEYNDAARTWDNSTYVEEYCNNSMLCVRDLMLSERYGLGEYYTSSSDFDTSEIITTIRECWKRYDPYSGEDYLKWWDSGTDSLWLTWWDFNTKTSTNITTTYNSSARTITIVGTGLYTTDNQNKDYLFLDISTITALKKGQLYDLSITLSGVDFSVNIYVRGINSDGTSNYLGKATSKSTGSHTISLNSNPKNYTNLQLEIYGVNGSSSFGISDISLTKEASSYEHYHTWNGVIESGQAALTVLLEMCDVFRCWPVWHSGEINFVSDRDTTPIQVLSVGNTEEFSQSFAPLSEIPYRLIGQFTDESRDYNMRSLVSNSSVSDLVKINERTIGLKGLTTKAKAERELKFKHSKIINSNNTTSLKCGIDILHGTAGDIIELQDDLPQWGHGGNILNYTATNFTIDTSYTFSNAATSIFTVKYQGIDNSQLTATIDTTNISTNDDLQVFPLTNIPASPCDLSAFSLNKTGYQSKKFRIIATSRTVDDMVDLTVLEHFSSLYDSEATLTIIDNYSPLVPPNPNIVPKAPVNINIVALSPYEGMGFAISARPNPSDFGVNEIVVQIDRTGDREFETIGVLHSPSWSTTYTDASLKFNYSYGFRLFCRTTNKTGVPAEASSTISGNASSIKPPKGLRIKGQTLNSGQFDGKDVTIIWDSIGLSTDLNYSVQGYKINIYKNSISVANLLRTDFVSTEEYTYTYDMNVGDNGTANGTLIFQLTTLTTNGWESINSSHITVSNSTPDTPTGLTTTPWMRGVQFNWNKNTETDLDYYSYRTKGIVGSLPITQQTGTFTAGNRLIQWNASGTVVASALIDNSNASYIYLSNITGSFVASKLVGEKTYGSELITNGDMELDANWTDFTSPTTNERSVEQAHGGTYSRKFVGDAQSDGITNSTSTTVANSFYLVNSYVYISALTAISLSLNLLADDLTNLGYISTNTTGSWVNLSVIAQAIDTTIRPTFVQSGAGAITAYVDDVSVKKITNAALANGTVTTDSWSSWNNITNTEVSRFLNEIESDNHPSETTISLEVKAVDVYANESGAAIGQDTTLGLNVQSTDIDNFAITSSKIFNKIPVITGDSWSDNTVVASEVQWNSHNLYYNGTLCVIASGHTSDKYIYWNNLATLYNTSASHPSSLASPIGDDDFIIAVNVSGIHDLAWNAIANQVIGSAYIQNLAVQSAHIEDLAVTTAKINDLAVTDAKIASLNAVKITANSITATQISANSITATQISANSITANEIRGSDFGTLTLSSGKIILNASNSIEVNATSGIKINIGGDLQLTGDTTNPAKIIITGTGSGQVEQYVHRAAYDYFYTIPNENDTMYYSIGNATTLWHDIGIKASYSGEFSCTATSATNITAGINLFSNQYGADSAYSSIGATVGAKRALLRCYVDSSGGRLQLDTDGSGYSTIIPVPSSKLKTSTGTTSGNVAAGTITDISMQDYCFMPNINNNKFIVYGYSAPSAVYTGRFAVYNNDSVNRTYTIYWRYVTSSDEPFMYVIRDKTTREVIATWVCEDPPPMYWGLNRKPTNFIPPIIITPSPKNIEDITIFKYPKNEYNYLIKKSEVDKEPIHKIITKNYDYDSKINLFKPKNLITI